jgi:hypothetical protein
MMSARTMRGTLLRCVLAVSVLVVGCPKPVTPSDWTDDPKTPAEGKAMCEAAAKRLDELQCQAARKDFVEFCTYELDNGIPLHPQCIAKIKVCSDVEKC